MTPSRPRNVSIYSEAQLREEALGWLVRLISGSFTRVEAEAFRRWCARSEEHRKAFGRAKRLWDVLGLAAGELAEPEASGSYTRAGK